MKIYMVMKVEYDGGPNPTNNVKPFLRAENAAEFCMNMENDKKDPNVEFYVEIYETGDE